MNVTKTGAVFIDWCDARRCVAPTGTYPPDAAPNMVVIGVAVVAQGTAARREAASAEVDGDRE